MATRYPGRLKIAYQSKGLDGPRSHRPGKQCEVERNESNPGQYIIWFGSRRFASVDAVKLHDVVDVEGMK